MSCKLIQKLIFGTWQFGKIGVLVTFIIEELLENLRKMKENFKHKIRSLVLKKLAKQLFEKPL